MTILTGFHQNGVSQVAKFGQNGRMALFCGPNFYLSILIGIYPIIFEIFCWYNQNDRFELFLPKWREPSGRIRLNRPDSPSWWANFLFEYLEKNLCPFIRNIYLVMRKVTNSSYFYRNGASQVAEFGQIGRIAHQGGQNFYLCTSKRIYAIQLVKCSW